VRAVLWVSTSAEATDKSRSQAGFFIKNVFQKQGEKDERRVGGHFEV